MSQQTPQSGEPVNPSTEHTAVIESDPTTTDAPKEVPEWTYRHAAIASAHDSESFTSPSLGMVGKQRMPGIVIVLATLTLGLYWLSWHRRINREMSDFDTRMSVAPSRSMWAVALPWLVGVATSAYGIVLILHHQLHITPPFGIAPTPLGYFLAPALLLVPYLELLFPFSLVALVMTAERTRICEDRMGVTSDVQLSPTRNTAWLLFPLIGGLIYMGNVQARLNMVWDLAAPPASNRRVR